MSRVTDDRPTRRTRTPARPGARRPARPEKALDRPIRIAVCGAGTANRTLAKMAEDVGREIAQSGSVLVCGGLGGVMEAAAKGAHNAGGLTIGILPGSDPNDANPWIAIPMPTDMGEARNALVVRFADAAIAVAGEWGTLSEIALAMKLGVPMVLLSPTLAEGLAIEKARDAADAVRRALRHARQARGWP
jgi:uncharacterized protein (TIGR00725 family)